MLFKKIIYLLPKTGVFLSNGYFLDNEICLASMTEVTDEGG